MAPGRRSDVGHRAAGGAGRVGRDVGHGRSHNLVGRGSADAEVALVGIPDVDGQRSERHELDRRCRDGGRRRGGCATVGTISVATGAEDGVATTLGRWAGISCSGSATSLATGVMTSRAAGDGTRWIDEGIGSADDGTCADVPVGLTLTTYVRASPRMAATVRTGPNLVFRVTARLTIQLPSGSHAAPSTYAVVGVAGGMPAETNIGPCPVLVNPGGPARGRVRRGRGRIVVQPHVASRQRRYQDRWPAGSAPSTIPRRAARTQPWRDVANRHSSG